MAAITRDDLVEDLAMRFGVYVTGSVSTDSDDTAIKDTTNLVEPDGFYVGNYMHIMSGPADGETRRIIDYDQYSSEIRVYPPFSADVATASTESFEVLPIQRTKLHQALNAGIVSAGATWPKYESDTTSISSISGGDYDYSLPSDVVQFLGVYTRATSSQAWIQVDPTRYEVSGTPGAQELVFSPSAILPVGNEVRLDYAARASTLSSATDTLGIGEPYEREAVDFVVNYGLYWLHDYSANLADNEAEFSLHTQKAQHFKEAAELIRAQSGHPLSRGEEEEE